MSARVCLCCGSRTFKAFKDLALLRASRARMRRLLSGAHQIACMHSACIAYARAHTHTHTHARARTRTSIQTRALNCRLDNTTTAQRRCLQCELRLHTREQHARLLTRSLISNMQSRFRVYCRRRRNAAIVLQFEHTAAAALRRAGVRACMLARNSRQSQCRCCCCCLAYVCVCERERCARAIARRSIVAACEEAASVRGGRRRRRRRRYAKATSCV